MLFSYRCNKLKKFANFELVMHYFSRTLWWITKPSKSSRLGGAGIDVVPEVIDPIVILFLDLSQWHWSESISLRGLALIS